MDCTENITSNETHAYPSTYKVIRIDETKNIYMNDTPSFEVFSAAFKLYHSLKINK